MVKLEPYNVDVVKTLLIDSVTFERIFFVIEFVTEKKIVKDMYVIKYVVWERMLRSIHILKVINVNKFAVEFYNAKNINELKNVIKVSVNHVML